MTKQTQEQVAKTLHSPRISRKCENCKGKGEWSIGTPCYACLGKGVIIDYPKLAINTINQK